MSTSEIKGIKSSSTSMAKINNIAKSVSNKSSMSGINIPQNLNSQVLFSNVYRTKYSDLGYQNKLNCTK